MTDVAPRGSAASDLVLKFDPHTIEHLGSNMYSRLPNAVAELVANSYDADATQISVHVIGSGESQRIVVEDNGHGMSRDDVRGKYLRIGRNRRGGSATAKSESGKRTVSGKKGLGKLALFGIGHEIEVSTTRDGQAERLIVTMNWEALIGTDDGDYEPTSGSEPVEPFTHGTSVTVSRLTRSSDISPAELAESLSRLFQYSDSEVDLKVIGRDGSEIPVTRELRIATVASEFKWDIPSDLPENSKNLSSTGVVGIVIAAEKPLPTQMRGVCQRTTRERARVLRRFGF